MPNLTRKQEETQDTPKLRVPVQNDWPVIFKSVKGMKIKDQETVLDT